MSTKVQKWGNSLALRFPKTLAERYSLRAGSAVRIIPRGRSIVIATIPKRKPTLKELVQNITPQNRHKEMDWGKSQGHEIW